MSLSGGRAVQLLRSVSAPTRPRLRAWPVLRAWRHIQTTSSEKDRRAGLDLPPFLKDLALGKFHKPVLSYGEVLGQDEYLSLEARARELRDYLANQGEGREEVKDTMRQSGLLGLGIPKHHGGAGFLQSEVARLHEELGCDLGLACWVSSQELLGYRALLELGTEEQKAAWLPRLAAGEITSAWCLTEAVAGSDPCAVQCRADRTEEGGYTVSGTKTWVTNGQQAGLLTVVCRTGPEPGDLTALLVDPASLGSGQLEVGPPYQLDCLAGLSICDLTFHGAAVPASAVLGGEGGGLQVVRAVQHGVPHLQTAALLASLKSLLELTAAHCSGRSQFERVLAELPLVRDRLGRMAGQLYGLESMLYLTTGLADCGADTEVESVVVRQFANQVADTVMSGCLDLFASRASLQSSPLQQAARDCAALQAWLGTPNINKCFVGVTLMQHLAAAKPELARIRQPANGNILESIRFQARWGRHRLGLYRSPHKLSTAVPEGLQVSARRLEWCTMKLQHVCELLLVSRGVNIQVEEEQLGRVADLVTEVYLVTAMLARSGRAMTLGLDHAEVEATMAAVTSFESKQRVKRLVVDSIGEDGDCNRDERRLHCGDYLAHRGGWVCVHPLSKNSW